MKYQVYHPNTVLSFLYQSRLRDTVLLYKLEFGKGRSCIILYEPDAYTGVQHLSFYALSTGWEKVTETGFKSSFIQYSNDRGGRIPSFQEMQDYWKAYCKDLGLITNSESHQMGLF